MKRHIRTLIIVIIVLVLLIVGCVCVVKFIPKDSSSDSDSQKDNVAVSQVNAENIVSISYSCEDTNYEKLTFNKNKEGEWHYSEIDDFPLNQKYLTNLASTLNEIDAQRIIQADEAGEMSEYGLDNPSLTIWFTEKDGTNHTYYVGNKNETTDNYYFKMDDDERIYQIGSDLKVGFMYSLYDLFDMETFPLVELSSYRHIDIKNGDQHLKINAVVEDDADEYISENDYVEKDITWFAASGDSEDYKKGNQITIKAIASEMTDYSFYRAVDYKVSKEDYKKYGLDNPKVVISVDYQVLDETTAELVEIADGVNEVQCDTIDKNYVLYVGNKSNDTDYADDYYVRIEGSDKIYTMETSVLERMLNLDIDSYFVSDSINN